MEEKFATSEQRLSGSAGNENKGAVAPETPPQDRLALATQLEAEGRDSLRRVKELQNELGVGFQQSDAKSAVAAELLSAETKWKLWLQQVCLCSMSVSDSCESK